MENVFAREDLILCGAEAQCELLDSIGGCEEIGSDTFIEEKGNEDSFATINNLFELWGWLGIDDLEKYELEFISASYIESDNEVNVKLKVDAEIKEFVMGIF